jgi:hypothetical protein
MKPNVFVHAPHCPEDFFSNSLAYVLNLLPSVGQRFVSKMADLAGRKPTFFGRFESCEFVGYEYPHRHSTSRPDLKLVCSARTLYIENKLESPLSVAQIQRHGLLTREDPKLSLAFVSNIGHRCPVLQSIPGYIHPRGQDHYQWVDLLPAFDVPYRKNSLGWRVLADFEGALKLNGMVGRTIVGARGSLYTSESEASHLALTQLRDQLLDIGYRVVRKSTRETTLRVYAPLQQRYPLLNPWFAATASWLDESLDYECLIFTVYSRASDPLLFRYLTEFPSRRECRFIPDPVNQIVGYTQHGYFVLPVAFTGRRRDAIDFQGLREPLTRLFHFLLRSR